MSIAVARQDQLDFPPPGYGRYEDPSFLQWLSLIRGNPLAAFPKSSYRERHMTWRLGPTNMVFLFDPELIEDVLLHQLDAFPKAPLQNRFLRPIVGDSLVTTEGKAWRRQRKTAAPMFRPRSLDLFTPGMTASIEEILEGWPTDKPVDVVPLAQNLGLSVLQHTLFSDAASIDTDAMVHSAARVLKGMGKITVVDLLGLPFMLQPGRWASKRHADKMRATIAEVIAARQVSGEDGEDLLGRFMSATDPESGEKMPDQMIADNILSLYGAGFETTAGSISWALQVMAENPKLQERVAAEAAALSEEEDPLKTCPLTLRVVKETLRLFPSVPVVIRMANRDVSVGDLKIRKGTLVYVCIFVSQRNELTWADAHRFDPDRFLPEAEAARHRSAFLPFGAGPRICIGMRFALMEAVLALAGLTRKFQFSEAPGNKPVPRQYLTIRAEGGINLIASPRS